MDCHTHEKHEIKCQKNKNDFTVYYLFDCRVDGICTGILFGMTK